MNEENPPLRQHPDREAVQAEVHTRPPLTIRLREGEVWHWLLFESEEYGDDWPEVLRPARQHQLLEIGDGLLRYERHTEFAALTYCGAKPPAADILNVVSRCPGALVAGLRLLFTEDETKIDEGFDTGLQLFGGRNTQYNVLLATDFLVRKNSLVTYRVCGKFDTPFARGTLVKRLIDLETYRTAALLGLPVVRSRMQQLMQLENQASVATRQLASSSDADLGNRISELAGILAELGTLHDATRYRIAASKAYYDIVKDRLVSIREERVGHRATVKGFVEYRLDPAYKTIVAFQRRTDDLFWTVRSTMALARTRLDLIAQRQNNSLLENMNESARQQVHLAQAVEGLSTAAITYYAVGLLSYLLKGLPDIAIGDSYIVAASVPVIAVFVWRMTRQAKKKIMNQH